MLNWTDAQILSLYRSLTALLRESAGTNLPANVRETRQSYRDARLDCLNHLVKRGYTMDQIKVMAAG